MAKVASGTVLDVTEQPKTKRRKWPCIESTEVKIIITEVVYIMTFLKIEQQNQTVQF